MTTPATNHAKNTICLSYHRDAEEAEEAARFLSLWT